MRVVLVVWSRRGCPVGCVSGLVARVGEKSKKPCKPMFAGHHEGSGVIVRWRACRFGRLVASWMPCETCELELSRKLVKKEKSSANRASREAWGRSEARGC